MVKRQWSRRDVLKSAAAGALGIGVGAAVYDRMDEYIVGTVDDDGVAAAASVSDAAAAIPSSSTVPTMYSSIRS